MEIDKSPGVSVFGVCTFDVEKYKYIVPEIKPIGSNFSLIIDGWKTSTFIKYTG